jgi:tRNA pseudouridine55 synthase
MDGTIIIDKPTGMTSHDVVALIRRLQRGSRVGHAGTLDPNATGVLCVLVGKATKTSRFLMGLEKEYIFTVQLGIETDTLDRWGTVLRRYDPAGVTAERILEAASRFKGRYQQIAPSVSALKHQGVPLYKLARRGQETPVKTRIVVIRSFEVVDMFQPYVTVRMVCSSGTYVRSLARDMGRYLGCGASVFCLRRTRVGGFRVDAATRLADIASGKTDINDVMLTIEESLGHMPRVRLKNGAASRIRLGEQPSEEDLCMPDVDSDAEYVALADENGMIVGIARRSGQEGFPLRTERVL